MGCLKLTYYDEGVRLRPVVLNNPVRYIDPDGREPEDRLSAAILLILTGAGYKQETTSHLRTGDSPEALAFMDCSEFVSRVMAAAGLTEGVLHMNTTGLISFLQETHAYIKKNRPSPGDIVAWVGHTGIIESYDPNSSRGVTILHSTRYELVRDGDTVLISGLLRENYSLDFFLNRGAHFYKPKSDYTFFQILEAMDGHSRSINSIISMFNGLGEVAY